MLLKVKMQNSDYLSIFFHVLLPVAYEVRKKNSHSTNRRRRVLDMINEHVIFFVTVFPRLGARVCGFWLSHWWPRGTKYKWTQFEIQLQCCYNNTSCSNWFLWLSAFSGGNVCYSRHLCPPHPPPDEPCRRQTVCCAGGQFVYIKLHDT